MFNSFWGHIMTHRFNSFWDHIMTLSLPLNDELYEPSLIKDLVYLDIAEGNPQEGLERLPHSLLVPKYNSLDYILILANTPNSRAYGGQS